MYLHEMEAVELHSFQFHTSGQGWRSRYSDSLRAGRSGYRFPVGAFSAPVQSGPGAHPASYTMGTGSFQGGKAAGAWRWAPTTT